MYNKKECQPNDVKFERRRFTRTDGSYIVSYARLEGDRLKFDVSQTRNLSEGGLSFIADRVFKKDTILKVKLRLPEFSDYVIVRVQVIASQKLPKGAMYGVRARFIEVEQKIKDAIKKLAEYA